MFKKLLVAATSIGLVAVPSVASANPYYSDATGLPHNRSYSNVYAGGGYGAYGYPYGSYYGNPYSGSYNTYGGYYGNSYNYRYNRHRQNNRVTGALVGGVIGAVIGSAIANSGRRY